MMYSQTEQYLWADRILNAVCAVGGITFMQLVSEIKTAKTNELRGLYCLITRDYNIHPERAARLAQGRMLSTRHADTASICKPKTKLS